MKIRPFPKDVKWVNTKKEIKLDDLIGNIVLLEFWTYCCVDCMHASEDVRYLKRKYDDDPLVVIGVHTPKFESEKEEEHVKRAIEKYGIDYPVIIDNKMEVFKEYNINKWPSFVLIGADGTILGVAEGENKRKIIDKAIAKELKDAKEGGFITEKMSSVVNMQHTDSFLAFPSKLAIDEKNRRLFITDTKHNRIVEVKLIGEYKAKVMNTIGSKESGLKDGSFEKSKFYMPEGIDYSDNKLYICDMGNHAVREVDLKKREVKTVAGNGLKAYLGSREGISSKISLNSPLDIKKIEDVLYVAMGGNHQIWQMKLSENVLDVLVGNGIDGMRDGKYTNSKLAQPSGITYGDGKLYFVDSETSSLRSVNLKDGSVESLIGNGKLIYGFNDGNLENALMQYPVGIYYKNQKLYVADTYNNSIRVVDLKERRVDTLIGSFKNELCTIDGCSEEIQSLNEPNDCIVFEEKIYIADTNNHKIRVFDTTTMKLEDLIIEK